jgi:hypothetical protein
MAAGAIPPPLFFERRRELGIFASWHICFWAYLFPRNGILRDTRKHHVDLAFERPARPSPTT